MLAPATKLFTDQLLLKFADLLSPSELSSEEQKVTSRAEVLEAYFFSCSAEYNNISFVYSVDMSHHYGKWR